ncbi:hypothetical protein NRS6148_02335 [Bacillus subtilis]|nr:hypothetical protein NRS6148_02335 [Bacillus subtilis]
MITKKFKYGYWYFGKGYSTITYKGLTEFFGHSDCDGVITPEMCKVIAEELEAIYPMQKSWQMCGCLMIIRYLIDT